MTVKELFKGIGEIDDDLIMEAMEAETKATTEKSSKNNWNKYIPLAACFVLIFAGGMYLTMPPQTDPQYENHDPIMDQPVPEHDIGQQLSFTGKIENIDNGIAVVLLHEGYDIGSPGDQVNVSLPKDIEFSVGDLVRVYYTGDVMESYPGEINVLRVEKIEQID